MPQRIPIKAAREVAKGYSCRQVIVLAWDGELTHIVTYGESIEDCAQAAAGGNMLKQKWGWPECNDQPSRVKKLEKELAAEREARERLEKERDALNDWKESASRVLNDIDLQGIGKLLGFALGSNIAKQILPAIQAEREARERAEGALRPFQEYAEAEEKLSQHQIDCEDCDARYGQDGECSKYRQLANELKPWELRKRALAALKSSQESK